MNAEQLIEFLEKYYIDDKRPIKSIKIKNDMDNMAVEVMVKYQKNCKNDKE